MIQRPIDPVRVEAHLAAAQRCLAQLETMAGLPPERFDDEKDFLTALMARALLREGLESLLSIGRHVLARRYRVAVTEYREVAVQLNRLGAIPAALRDDFVSLARLRNLLTHAYLAVSPSELHEVVAHRLSLLRRLLDALVTAAGLGPFPSGAGPASTAGEKRVRYRKTLTGGRTPADARKSTEKPSPRPAGATKARR
ncbi:MAG: DUF86 domain-containing protein [Deltaproteobacteria bacterium]|nr:DUF86 domain-containing protein [Deltaproteobacteria bacterium]